MQAKLSKQVNRLLGLMVCLVGLHAVAQEPMQIYFDINQQIPQILNPNALELALIQNDSGAAQKAIAEGAHLNKANAEGVYPLMLAAAYGDAELMKLLIAQDVDLSVRDAKGRSVMHLLAMRGAIDQMKLVLILQPKLAQQADKDGWVPLYVAYANGHFEAADYLQDNRFDHVNRPGPMGLPRAFHFVRKLDNPEAMEHMIANDLNLFKRTVHDQTLHAVAFEAGHEKSGNLVEKHFEEQLKAYRKKLQQKARP